MADKEFIQKNADRLIFALDTGTRSVVGVLGLWEDDVFHIVDYEQCPHKTRAMKDGQIEDIGQAARAIQTVKNALEQRWNIQLTKASIAAAGRALKTVEAEFGQEIPVDTPITAEQIRSIEYGAVSAALDTFCQKEEDPGGSSERNPENEAFIQPGDFSCVGYSVSGYWLDDYPIRNLEGHRGKRVRASVIAAFLPQSVVRSLYAATGQCGLQVASLTLEPIAAIQAIVPGDLRLLNLAIADIGAGTSDIAVTRNGSVVAYDMVTLAGDEITEALMRRCLTDFDTAEQIKLSLCRGTAGESIPFTDILGNACSIDFQTAMETVEPAAEALCRAITDCIVRINGSSPAAVFLIGGGSQLGGLARRIADRLELPENRVALGGTRPYSHIQVCSQQLLSPEFVTPLGIGAISTLVQENDYLSVQINQQKVMIPGTGSLKIVDALLLAGIRSSSLMGRTPPSLVFYKNNQPQTFRSAPSTPGELYRNGIPATLNTQIRQGDEITLIPAKNGASPQVFLRDICDFGENVICTVNGLPGAPDYLICPQDDIRIFSPDSSPDENRRSAEVSAEDGRRSVEVCDEADRRPVEMPDEDDHRQVEMPDEDGRRPVEMPDEDDHRQVEMPDEDGRQYEALFQGKRQKGHDLPEAFHSMEVSQFNALQPETPYSEVSQPEALQTWAAGLRQEPTRSETIVTETIPIETVQTETPQIETLETVTTQNETPQTETLKTVTTLNETSHNETLQTVTTLNETPHNETLQTEIPQASAAQNEWTGELRVQLNGRWVTISRPPAGSLYFVDLLNYVDIDPKKPNGSPVLLLNGREAAYLDPVIDGDQVEIRWSKEKGFPSQNG